MEPFKTRGYVYATTLKYCREGMHPDRRQRVVDKITPDLVRWIEGVKPADWYPLENLGQMFDAIVAASEGNPATAREDLIGTGKFAALEATNTFLRLVMRVLTPGLFAKKLPSLYERDNSKGKVQVRVTDEKLVIDFSDTKGFPHLAPMSAGWATFALTTMGKEIAKCDISGWSLRDADVDSFKIDLTWKR